MSEIMTLTLTLTLGGPEPIISHVPGPRITTYTIEVPDSGPDYVTPLFQFIDSEESAEFLEDVIAGEMSLGKLVRTFEKQGILPGDSLKTPTTERRRVFSFISKMWKVVYRASRKGKV